jgi:hypothetical protein
MVEQLRWEIPRLAAAAANGSDTTSMGPCVARMHGEVEVGQLDRLRLPVIDGLGHGRERVRALLHLEVHPDLEEPQRGELADRLGARQALQHLQRAVEPERRAGLGRDREPDVEVVVAEVVVGHPGCELMTLAARQGFSASTFAATSIEL